MTILGLESYDAGLYCEFDARNALQGLWLPFYDLQISQECCFLVACFLSFDLLYARCKVLSASC